MKINVIDSKLTIEGIPTQSPELVDLYLCDLKERLAVSWAELAPIFDMPPVKGSTSNIHRWRRGASPMPQRHWIMLLALIGKIQINEIQKKTPTEESWLKNQNCSMSGCNEPCVIADDMDNAYCDGHEYLINE